MAAPNRFERNVAARSAWAVSALVACAALVAAVFMPKWLLNAAIPKSGQLTVISQPSGAGVTIDGQRRGVTPLTLALPIGAHALQLNGHHVTRVIVVTIKPGAEVTRRVDLDARPAPDTGRWLATSEPSGPHHG